MTAALGQSALVAAFLISSVSALVLFCLRKDRPLLALYGGRMVLLFVFLLLFFSFGSLIWSYVSSDFTLLSVGLNSHREAPLLYKISGVWGNHEGSMVLWLLILSGFGAAALRIDRDEIKSPHVSVLFLVLIAYIAAFIYFTSNPFLKVKIPFLQGRDLNPILQDPALAIHPPILYMGYVGFVVPYVLMIADRVSLRVIRRWTLFAWSFLSLGIGLGSWWAYYELGWGGWWFWDPVENASLMPWLTGTALIHSLHVSHKRKGLLKTTHALGIGAFLFSILGTFLVRSGVLSSVHAFASDPERGLWIAILLCFLLLLGAASFLKPSNKVPPPFLPLLSRERVMAVGIGIFLILLVTLVLGTLYPLFLEKLGGPLITVGAPYFNATFLPLAWMGLLLLPLSLFLKGGRGTSLSHLRGLLLGVIGVCAVLLITAFLERSAPPRFWISLLVSAWVISGTFSYFLENRREWSHHLPMLSAHAGLGVMMLGMTIDGFLTEEKTLVLKQGESAVFREMTLTLKSVSQEKEPTYLRETAFLSVKSTGEEASLFPEKRFYPGHETLTTEVALKHRWFSDLYISLGSHYPPDRWALRVSYHPFVSFIWLGVLLMALGGFFAIGSRRSILTSERTIFKEKGTSPGGGIGRRARFRS